MVTDSEGKFYSALEDIFIGKEVEGESGFINLIRIKSSYYRKINVILRNDIEKRLKELKIDDFKEEMYDKLYSFFKTYFSETGSIYYTDTPYQDNIFERVYSNEEDVMLFWKTHMLYYVKSDILTVSMEVPVNGHVVYFDVGALESKKAWEQRVLIYEFAGIDSKGRIVLKVRYSNRGKRTDYLNILTNANTKLNNNFTEEDLESAINTFQKQNEVDFFLNRNVKSFLTDKFKLWIFQYINDETSFFDGRRILELKILTEFANRIIDFIAQFEKELLKIWQKPKFVLNSSYVITLDKIANKENGIKIIKSIISSPGFNEQVKEWKELKLISEDFNSVLIINESIINNDYKSLPLDLKYFKDLRYKILDLFKDLDKNLDGWLVHSENWQALNTLLPKFKEQVQTIYIDPPFIKVQDPDYYYKVNFKNASWLTLLNNRLELAKEFLSKKGSIFVCSDNSCNHYTHLLLSEIFNFFRGEIIWCYEKPGGGEKYFKNNHASIYYYSKSDEYVFNPILVSRKGENELMKRDGKFPTDYEGKKAPDWWIDIPSFATAMTARERINKLLGIQFPTQQPESLLKRIIEASSNEGDLIMDFFLGSGTTIATAHKLKRKWIGIELGQHFEDVILKRMKIALRGRQKGNSRYDTKMSEDINWNGGGFFKYYILEQYIDTLKRVKYSDSGPIIKYSENPYNEYVFMKDEKLLSDLEVDYNTNKVKLNLDSLYQDIDMGETLSNLSGKKIKKLSKDSVVFEDNEEIQFNDVNYMKVKPLIWWEL